VSKIVYERPILVDLNALSDVYGGTCSDGSSANANCNPGGHATIQCNNGSVAGKACGAGSNLGSGATPAGDYYPNRRRKAPMR
jgi:hypothetical protein